MIAGLDSSFDRPTPAVAQAARAAGIGLWSGYLATRGGVGLASPWDLASFDAARLCGGVPLAFCSGQDDPAACAAQAAAWNVRLCLDVEPGIRADGPWVQGWLDASGAGLYGLQSVHSGRRAAFHVMALWPGSDPGASWLGVRPADGAPCGWQWQGGHIEFGLNVDRGWYDDFFGGDMATIDDVYGLLQQIDARTGQMYNFLNWGTPVGGDPPQGWMPQQLAQIEKMISNLQVPPANLKPVLDAIAALKADLDSLTLKKV